MNSMTHSTTNTITYEMILEYLAPPINNFSNQPNIILNSSKFAFFKHIFDDSFFRVGVVNSDNMSLYNSIIYCLKSEDDKLKSLTYSGDLLQISESFHFNIIIFDFKNNKMMGTHYGEFFNPWRPTIFLAKYEQWWEPIVSTDCSIFSFSTIKSNIIKYKVLSSEIFKYNENNTCHNITINDNFNEIIDIDGFTKSNKIVEQATVEQATVEQATVEQSTTHEMNQSNEPFISNNTNISQAKLDKMKKDELLQVITTRNIIINISRPTKKDLIKLILESM